MMSSGSLLSRIIKLVGLLTTGVVILLVLPIGQAAWVEVLGVSGQVATGVWTTPTTMKITPQSLQKCSQGIPVNARFSIDLSPDADIDSVRLCRGSDPCDESGVPAVEIKIVGQGFTATFDRAAVIALVDDVPSHTDVTLTVSAVIDGRQVIGSDVIKIVDCKSSNSIEDDVLTVAPRAATPSPTAASTPTVEPSPEAEATATPTAEATPEAETTATPTAEATQEPDSAPPEPTPSPTEEPSARAAILATPTPAEPTQTETVGGAP